MKKIINLIEGMTREEISELQKGLEEGTLKKEVENKLEKFKNANRVCPVCNAAAGDEGLTLIFGPKDLKQKATFDGQDCLTYFINNMRK